MASKEILQAIKHAIAVAEQYIESDFVKAENFFAPIIKEVLVAFGKFSVQDLVKIAEGAASLFVPGASEVEIGEKVFAEVCTLAKAQAPELGHIALQGLANNLAALGKQTAAADPASNTNQ